MTKGYAGFFLPSKAEDLERLKIKLATGARTEHRKPASINRFLQDLKAVFCKAADTEKLERNPFNGVDLLNENNKQSRELTPDEELRLCEKIPTHPPALRPYFRFLLATGHAFAIRRLRGGANLVAVSALLRHASTRMSERYLHVTRADLRTAAEAGQPLTLMPCCILSMCPDLPRISQRTMIDLKEASRKEFLGLTAPQAGRMWAREERFLLGED